MRMILKIIQNLEWAWVSPLQMKAIYFVTFLNALENDRITDKAKVQNVCFMKNMMKM